MFKTIELHLLIVESDQWVREVTLLKSCEEWFSGSRRHVGEAALSAFGMGIGRFARTAGGGACDVIVPKE